MIKRGILIGVLLISSNCLFSQAGVGMKSFSANQAFVAGDYDRALRIYLQTNTAKPNDPPTLYRIGKCYQALQDYDKALEFLQKAETIDTNASEDLHLALGQVYHQDDRLDDALKEYLWHRRKISDNAKKMKDDKIDYLISEIGIAKQMESHPANVKVRNAGVAINSEYDDKSPSVTADGSTLIFTSIRPLSVTDKNSSSVKTSELFDNVYICKWDSDKNDWGLSYPIPGEVNQPLTHTSCTSISPDGNYIFLYRNSITGESVGGDIYMSKKSKAGKWGTAMTLGHPVNTSYYEDGACLAPDGNTLYFVSERPGGFGRADIYKSYRESRTEWGKPENLGRPVNSEDDEGSPFMAPDGHTLFFSSDGHNSMGGYDIFKTALDDTGKWITPINLGYPVNTVCNEKCFTISADARTAYFSSDRPGGIGKRDIYIADLSNYSVLASDSSSKKPKGYSILRGKITTIKGVAVEEALVTVMDSDGVKMASTNATTDGNYFITLKGNARYKIKISSKGYKSASKPIHLADSPVGTFTMQQDFTLEKE
jgi:hypothetical protein